MISFALGVLLGLSMAAPPGPVNAMILKESMKSKLHGSSVGFGAMTADFIFFLVVYFIRGDIPPLALRFLYLVGGLLLLFLAYLTLKSSPSVKTSVSGNYFTGLIMGLTNPYQISWWVTIGIYMIDSLGALSALGFFSGIALWVLAFPYFSNLYVKRYVKYVNFVSFVILASFGAYILIQGIRLL